MKPIDIDNYDPISINGLKVGDSWFDAINMVIPTFIDPHVMKIYKLYFSKRTEVDKKIQADKIDKISRAVEIQIVVKWLIARYNQEGNNNE